MPGLLSQEINKYFQNTNKGKIMLGSEKQYFPIGYLLHFFISLNVGFTVILNTRLSWNFWDISRKFIE